MLFILAICLSISLIYIAALVRRNGSLNHLNKIKDSLCDELGHIQCEVQIAQNNCVREQNNLDNLRKQIALTSYNIEDGHAQLAQTNIEIKEATLLRDQINNSIEEKKAILDSNLAQLRETYAKMEADCNARCEERRALAAQQIEQIDADTRFAISEKENAAKLVLEDLAAQLENERVKYLSVLETVQRLQPDEEKDLNRHVIIYEAARDDISYLLNNVANKLSNPDILYKLIWSEYIQKPTNEMLDYILPAKDCAGIYKITNDRNKKAYIGRSTSVRKRLTDHIKSAIGISTIADQRIHQVIREEGIWNFTFELIEECEKNQLSEREKYYINFFSTEKLGYNLKAGG